jgi:3-(3-hydroxy-phenyl)propionate hydroxylase
MLSTYTYPRYAYRRPAELDRPGTVPRHPVVVVGAGPVGLAAAIDLAQHGLRVLLLDEDDTVSVGSRGLCYAKRALEILDRLGCGDTVVNQGVNWSVGRTFFGEQEVFRFNLLPEADHRRPAMVNLQQYYLEQALVERAMALPGIDLRWKNKVTAVAPGADGAQLEVETADGRYALHADWLIVADGARSPIRRMLGLDVEGKVFQDRFLIADVVMKADFPAERWFWFDPPFHRGQSVLLHRQAAGVWRIDFQLGWEADPEEEKKPERVIPRIRAMLAKARPPSPASPSPPPEATQPARDDPSPAEQHPFDLEWVSVYTFQCRRMQRFRHGRVLFVGDAAHQVSPFGARGANSGIQDTDNLVWKLALVLDGKAPESLLDSYSDERVAAADENILNSTRSTDFITPKSQASRDLRNAVLTLAREHAFARALVNSGRLSVPAHLSASALNTPDADPFEGVMHPGAPIADAPVRSAGTDGWLLQHTGERFVLLLFVPDAGALDATTVRALRALADAPIPVHTLIVSERDGGAPDALACVTDVRGVAARRFDARPGTAYLLRPDQHVAARWRRFDAAAVRTALARATCNA